MLLPSQFARAAVIHGTVATVSDPHEIANVCGVDGVELMLRNSAQSPFKFCFGAPACVPATSFETAGAMLDVQDVDILLQDSRIGYLSEMMNFPGVLNDDESILQKIAAAKRAGKPVDGHAPGLRGKAAAKYIAAGITTDHECVSIDEALDKIQAGCKIAIREGSAARNFESLQQLIDSHPEHCMLCSDDKHPDELLLGHINQLAARAIASGRELMNVLKVACLNPIRHYGLPVGFLQPGDSADFIVVDDLRDFRVRATWIDGQKVSEGDRCLMPEPTTESINQFVATEIKAEQLSVPAESPNIRVIQAIDGQLITKQLICAAPVCDGMVVSDTESDILKIVVLNRYQTAEPAIAFINGFQLQQGALASSVAHDSHNIVAVGTNDDDLTAAINAVIEHQGGLTVAAGGDVDVLPLPVAGLMSTGTCQEVASIYTALDSRVKQQLGCTLRAPFMTLSFMALLVIPSLKLGDKGLFDVDAFDFVSLFVNESD